MRHLLRQRCLPAIAHLRAGLRAPLLVLMAALSLLVPHWPGETPAATTASLTTHVPAHGEEAPPGESAEQETPAKLRRVASLQEPRAASGRCAPPRRVAQAADIAPPVRSSVPAPASALSTALPVRWQLQRSQAPPLA